jgi:hypothetical protein
MRNQQHNQFLETNILNYFFILIFTICANLLNAQDGKESCGADQLHLKSLKEDASYKRKFEKNNADWQIYAPKHKDDWDPKAKNNARITTTPDITLTVVFHDVSASNTFLNTTSIADYQYIVDKLNLIYDGTNLNGTSGNNSHINFCLATKNQYGDTYLFSNSRTPNVPSALNLNRMIGSQIDAVVTATNASVFFDQHKYINIYIVDSIVGAAGFATLASSHGTTKDGIFISRQYLINDSSLNLNMNVLAHEMGHYLGLFHTFGICDPSLIGNLDIPDPSNPGQMTNPCSCDNNNCMFNGDMVCDTPPNMLIMSGYNASSFPNSCHTDATFTMSDGSPNNPTSDISDPKDNFMDYGISNYQIKFTYGQITRMHFMIDPDNGPRKSLLGQAACANCTAMNSCIFNIIPNVPNSGASGYKITQIGGTTPAITFSSQVSGTCFASTNSDLNYKWTLVQLGSNNISVFQNVSSSNYTTSATLPVGNYLLTLTAALISNNQCFETTTLNFSIVPEAGVCPIELPLGNNLTDWTDKQWTRRTSDHGWVLNSSSQYPVGSHQYNNTDPGFDATGFDVLPITTGGIIPGDTNFTGVALPPDANINSIIRVGKISGGGDQAFYAKKKITINRNNCRFKIWYLGATTGNYLNTAVNFQNNTYSNDAAFGFVSKYNYNSPVFNASTSLNSTIGSDENLGNSNYYFSNMMVSQLFNSNATNDFYPINNYFHSMNGWKSMIVDYSEFVDLANDTEITLTFFSHSNINAPAFQEAYAYYGIECLGGGIPSPIDFDLQNQSIPCNSPNQPSCVTYLLPVPKYDINQNLLQNNIFAFDKVTVYKIIGGIPSTTPYPISLSFGNSGVYNLTFCLNQSDAPFQDFKIEYKTLHETLVSNVRVFVGFYNTLTDCTTGDAIDTNLHPDIINGDILLCGMENLPELHLTDTCITLPHTYQWYSNGTASYNLINGATNPTLQLTSSNYNPKYCFTYFRKTIYNEPYCSNPKEKISEVFHVYNTQAITLKNSSATSNDICFGSQYILDLLNPNLTYNNFLYSSNLCTIPSHFDTNFINHLNFQMYDPVSHQPIGNIINYTFTGQIVSGQNISNNPFEFIFNNINPTTGNPLFVPTPTSAPFPIDIQITGDYLGCPISPQLHTFQIKTINFSPSAIGGAIKYNCTDLSVTNQDSGITFGGYGWEYSNDGTTFIPISGAPTTNNLSASFVNSLLTSNPTVYIRRRSNGTTNCPNSDYSNVIILTNHPQSVTFSTSALPISLCAGATSFTLPTTSTNGIIGTWNVLSVNTTATATYTFTPLEGYCLPKYNYTPTIQNNIVPTFNPFPAICLGQSLTLPTASTNGITGTWSPIPVNNTATTDYTFHPNPGQCSSTDATVTVVVNASTVTPTFNIPTAICSGSTPPILPNLSINNIAGHWSPTTISNTISETYTFTPDNSCALPTSIDIIVIENCGITLTWGSEVSCQVANVPNHGVKDYDANIADGPCIRVCENSTITYTLAGGGIGTIDHTVWNVTGGTINTDPQYTNNTTCTITWGAASYCALQGIIYLNNGTTLQINKCIEKLATPIALFGILPNMEVAYYTECVNTPINFENLSTNNGGNDVLYYNWDFGDGTTSNEFEPSHTYTEVRDYIVTLQVFNGCSCSSKYEITVKIINNKVNIQCPSVVCEGERTSYSIDYQLGKDCDNIHWNIVGGHQIGHNDNNTQIDVVWDNVDQDGFGYISVYSPTCFRCSTPVKIPVIKQHGIIMGNDSLCPKSQGTYTLPQWPSTIFNWTINDGGTGATIINNNNRNEIIVQSQSNGTIQLFCTYFNTLLGCGGSTQYTIHVKPFARLEGPYSVCQNKDIDYQIINENGNSISTIDWTIEGPNGYTNSGNHGHFITSFPIIGTYNFTINNTNYCSQLTQITVKEAPVAPTAITGPLVVCPGIPVSYSCPPSSDAVTHWEVIGGNIIGSTTGNTITVNFDAIPSTLTTYTLKVWYESELCNSNTLFTTIHRDVPVFSITAPNATVCGSTTMTYSTAYTTGENYIWSVSPETAGSVQSGQNSPNCTILWNQATSNPNPTVKLEIRKCSATYSATYNVHVINHPDITINAPTALCSNVSFTPTFTMSVGTSYSSVTWDYGDGTIETLLPSEIASHDYITTNAATTSYMVVATVHGGNGCLADATNHLQVTVATAPIIDVNLPDQYNICNNHNATNPIFEASVNVQSGFSATNIVQWYRQDGTGTHVIPAPQGNAYVINVSNTAQGFGAGTYWASVTNVFNCTSITDTFNVIDDCGTPPIGPGGPGGLGCNCTYDYNVTYPCQSVEATISNTSCNLVQTDWYLYPHYPSDVVTSNTLNNYAVSNLKPGKYLLKALMQYDYASTPCFKLRETNFIVPYQAGVRYNVTCNSNTNSYTVTVVDHSVFYPQVGIQKYEFTTNGYTWIDQGTATSYQSVLSPGTYILGVKISTPGYTPCIATVTLVLPDMPSAALSHAPYACQDTAMQFNALDNTFGLQYSWDFDGSATNLQQNPVRTFNGFGTHFATLTVTNQYGCFATSPMTSVQVKQVKLAGTITGIPKTTCEGNSITLNYQPNTNPIQVMPTNFTWYHNEVTNPAYANTTTPSIPVSMSGQYFAYVQDSNGCKYYKNDAVSVAFIPLPTTPVIKGDAIACVGSPIQLSIPNDPTMSYEWSIMNNGNNVVNHAWDNLTVIQDTQTTVGNYSYSVVARVANTGTPDAYCSSNAGTFTVNVVAEPDIPELKIEVASCIPYRVRVSVLNPQNGVNYHWSNGYTGLETMITHDGPLQVRAEVFNCSVTAQIDLPRDLTALAWTFPKGCYAVCTKQPLGYLVGPLGVFKEWDWIEDNNVIDTDNNSSIRDLHDLQPNSAYQLHIFNEYCDTTLGTVEITETECKECAIEYKVKKIDCINIDGVNLYAVTIDCNNPYGTVAGATLSVAGGEGYFDSSILQLPAGSSTQTILFNSLSGFQGGDVTVTIQSHWKEEWCVSQLRINFPEDCKEVGSCNFGYDIRRINCITTPYGNIYDIEVIVYNPYPIQASTTLSVPDGHGFLVPTTIQVAPGTNTYHFSMYPQNGFNGGAVNLVFNSGFASFFCRKEGKFDFPELCTEPRSCEFEYAFTEPRCQSIGANNISYQVNLSVFNPTGDTATMTLMTPYGAGYFVSNNLLLPPNASYQTFYFYPTIPGFLGGDVTVTILIHSKDGICFAEQTLKFENCCFRCPINEKIAETTTLIYNILRIAPNPANAVTTIFYNFVNDKAVKTIELTDLLGRSLKSWTPTETSGKIELDCTVYANGQYLILMKEDNKIIETAKLITN